MITTKNTLHESSRSLSNLHDLLYFSSGNASISIGDDLVLLFSIVVVVGNDWTSTILWQGCWMSLGSVDDDKSVASIVVQGWTDVDYM